MDKKKSHIDDLFKGKSTNGTPINSIPEFENLFGTGIPKQDNTPDFLKNSKPSIKASIFSKYPVILTGTATLIVGFALGFFTATELIKNGYTEKTRLPEELEIIAPIINELEEVKKPFRPSEKELNESVSKPTNSDHKSPEDSEQSGSLKIKPAIDTKSTTEKEPSQRDENPKTKNSINSTENSNETTSPDLEDISKNEETVVSKNIDSVKTSVPLNTKLQDTSQTTPIDTGGIDLFIK